MQVRSVSTFNNVYYNKQYKSNPYVNNNIGQDIWVRQCPKYNAISFEGVDGKGKVKQRGLLMHITSLPAHNSYCGQFLDPQTEQFIDWMCDSKQTHWIMNPLNALEDNLCPYSASGRFSRNKFIVNLNKLTEKEYGKILKQRELPDDITVPQFTLDMLERQKNPRFKIAFNRFKNLSELEPIKIEYKNFIKENDTLWLDDYANYDMLARRYGTDWTKWPKALQTAPEDSKTLGVSLNDYVINVLDTLDMNINPRQIEDEVNLYKFEQFLYDKQFNEMTQNLKDRGINLIMDYPIGVSATGVDTWGKKNIFLLDENCKPIKVSGCPPEPSYPYTQVWGHALYDYDSPDFWDYHEKSLKLLLKNADLRLDHFVGYINRAEIPTSYTKPDGTVLIGTENIFKPVEKGGMGVDFFDPKWIKDVSNKRNKNNENLFDVFCRIAYELGKKPEDTYILENFGPLSKTEAYKKFDRKYGKNFISQRVPIAIGVKNAGIKADKLNSPFGLNDPNVAILTGNHDLPSLKETIDDLMNIENKRQTKSEKKSSEVFDRFCREELNLTAEEKNNIDDVYLNTMKWFYTRGVKQVQTTLQDALGIYWRPNIPGYWNGMEDKFMQKATPEALLPFWCKVFPKDFLSRDNVSGINPGYKDFADRYTHMMNDLYPDV